MLADLDIVKPRATATCDDGTEVPAGRHGVVCDIGTTAVLVEFVDPDGECHFCVLSYDDVEFVMTAAEAAVPSGQRRAA
ncbi:MAG: hypothetical protein QM679_03785 [Patulibacter sp.]